MIPYAVSYGTATLGFFIMLDQGPKVNGCHFAFLQGFLLQLARKRVLGNWRSYMGKPVEAKRLLI